MKVRALTLALSLALTSCEFPRFPIPPASPNPSQSPTQTPSPGTTVSPSPLPSPQPPPPGLAPVVLSPSSGPHATDDTPLVLMYHDIIPNGATPDASSDVYLDQFIAQLDALQSAGFQTISILDVRDALLGRKKLAPNSLLLTFDDGYEGNYTYAYPILKQRNLQATFFVHTDWIGRNNGTLQHMTVAQLKELDQDPLFHIYPHTKSHPHLNQPKEVDPSQWAEEICGSRRILESLIGGKREIFAYPYGVFHRSKNDLAIIKVVMQCYVAAFAIEPSPLIPDELRYSGYTQPRVMMQTQLDIPLFVKEIQKFQAQYQSDLIRFKPGCAACESSQNALGALWKETH